MWSHRGITIPLEVYHGVPDGWHAHEIISEHARLGANHELHVPLAAEPGAPSWLPERHEWLQYRAALYAIADGVSARDPACIELAVRFIELRYIGSYSGFIREKLSRRLSHAELTGEQKRRLHEHLRQLVLGGERTQEFRSFLKLWRRIVSEAEREQLLSDVRLTRGDTAANWLAARLK